MTLVVRGRPTREEIAAVLAVLRAGTAEPPPDRYTDWRRTRLDALRRTGMPPV